MAFRSRSKKIGRNGNITTPGQIRKSGHPAFKVRSNNSTATQTGTWVWTVEDFDQGGDFDLTNNRFTAPVDGLYFFSFNVIMGSSGSGTNNDIGYYQNGAFVTGTRMREDGNNTNYNGKTGVAILELDQDDYIDVRIITGSGYNNSTQYSGFYGYLVG